MGKWILGIEDVFLRKEGLIGRMFSVFFGGKGWVFEGRWGLKESGF